MPIDFSKHWVEGDPIPGDTEQVKPSRPSAKSTLHKIDFSKHWVEGDPIPGDTEQVKPSRPSAKSTLHKIDFSKHWVEGDPIPGEPEVKTPPPSISNKPSPFDLPKIPVNKSYKGQDTLDELTDLGHDLTSLDKLTDLGHDLISGVYTGLHGLMKSGIFLSNLARKSRECGLPEANKDKTDYDPDKWLQTTDDPDKLLQTADYNPDKWLQTASDYWEKKAKDEGEKVFQPTSIDKATSIISSFLPVVASGASAEEITAKYLPELASTMGITVNALILSAQGAYDVRKQALKNGASESDAFKAGFAKFAIDMPMFFALSEIPGAKTRIGNLGRQTAGMAAFGAGSSASSSLALGKVPNPSEMARQGLESAPYGLTGLLHAPEQGLENKYTHTVQKQSDGTIKLAPTPGLEGKTAPAEDTTTPARNIEHETARKLTDPLEEFKKSATIQEHSDAIMTAIKMGDMDTAADLEKNQSKKIDNVNTVEEWQARSDTINALQKGEKVDPSIYERFPALRGQMAKIFPDKVPDAIIDIEKPLPKNKKKPEDAVSQGEPTTRPMPKFNSVDDAINYRNQRIRDDVSLYAKEWGVTEEQSRKLNDALAADETSPDGNNFDNALKRLKLSPDHIDKINKWFDESPLNQKDHPYQPWQKDRTYNPEQVPHETDPKVLSDDIVSLARSEFSVHSDRSLYQSAALHRLAELGGTKSDIIKAIDRYTTRNSGSMESKAEYFKTIQAKVLDAMKREGINLPDGELNKPKTVSSKTAKEIAPPPQPAKVEVKPAPAEKAPDLKPTEKVAVATSKESLQVGDPSDYHIASGAKKVAPQLQTAIDIPGEPIHIGSVGEPHDNIKDKYGIETEDDSEHGFTPDGGKTFLGRADASTWLKKNDNATWKRWNDLPKETTGFHSQDYRRALEGEDATKTEIRDAGFKKGRATDVEAFKKAYEDRPPEHGQYTESEWARKKFCT